MESVQVIAQQLLTMCIFMLVGWVLARAELITGEGSKSLSNLLLYVVLPCAIINSFNLEPTAQRTADLLVSIGLGALVLLLAIVVAWALLRKHPVHNFSAAFSNAGFMGIPLISSVLGSHAVFYLAGMVAMLNVLQWTYGQRLLGGARGGWRGVVKNPLLIGFLLGLVCYFIPVQLPAVLAGPISSIAICNAPLAMFILGVFLSRVKPRRGLVRGIGWITVAVRLLLIPLLTILLLWPFAQVPYEIRMALLIAASAPVGSNVAVYAQRLGANVSDATVVVCLSTVLSLLSMPVVVLTANAIWRLT